MGPLALRRFEEAEESAKTEINAKKVVQGLLDDQGTARELIERLSIDNGPVGIPLRYRRVTGAQALPDSVFVKSPTDVAREKIFALFRKTLDPKIIILARVDDHRFDEDLLAMVTPACLQDLQQVTMTLFFGPRWRSIVVKMALNEAAD